MHNRSRSTSNSSPSETPSWRSSRDYGYHEPNNASYDSNFGHLFLPTGSRSSRSIPQDFRGSIEEAPRSFARRTSSFGSARASFPSPNHRPPMQMVIFEPQTPRESSHWPVRALPVGRAAGDRHRPNAAVESLKKEFYNPSTKRITNAVNLYYRDTPVDPTALASEDDGKRCSVCLEDFERGCEVAVTPCKHMFHRHCIVPWANDNPHCPVCRSALGPKARQPSSSASSANTLSPTRFDINSFYDRDDDHDERTRGPGLSTQEFLSILRALGDGFQLQ